MNNLSQVGSCLCFSLFQKFTNQFRGRRKSCRAHFPDSGSGQESRTAACFLAAATGAAGDLGAGAWKHQALPRPRRPRAEGGRAVRGAGTPCRARRAVSCLGAGTPLEVISVLPSGPATSAAWANAARLRCPPLGPRRGSRSADGPPHQRDPVSGTTCQLTSHHGLCSQD